MAKLKPGLDEETLNKLMAELGVTSEELFSFKKFGIITHARREIVKYMRERGFGYAAIGRTLEIDRHAARRLVDKEFATRWDKRISIKREKVKLAA